MSSTTAMLQLKQCITQLSECERDEVSAFLHLLKQESPAGQKEIARRLGEIEIRFGIRFPDRHRELFFDLRDPIHDATDFLTLSASRATLDISLVNDSLRRQPAEWPDFLIAFASNGCGDYFAYDRRLPSLPIIYIDPDFSVQENLASPDKLQHESFAKWYTEQLKK